MNYCDTFNTALLHLQYKFECWKKGLIQSHFDEQTDDVPCDSANPITYDLEISTSAELSAEDLMKSAKF